MQARGWQALQGGHGVAVGEMTAPHVISCKHSWAPAICEFYAMNVGCSFLTPSVECESILILSLPVPASGFIGTPR